MARAVPSCPEDHELVGVDCRCTRKTTRLRPRPKRTPKSKTTKKKAKPKKAKKKAKPKKAKKKAKPKKVKKKAKLKKTKKKAKPKPKKSKTRKRSATPQRSLKAASIHVAASKGKAYSPSINKLLLSLKTLSPDAKVFRCAEKEIAIPKGKGHKCVNWESKEAQQAMLRNLVSKKAIRCRDIIAPKQVQSNCWFNTFFMCCFVSDKGRKFFRFLRQTMITGRLPNGKAVAQRLRWPLFLMNKCIDASLRGKNDKSRYAWLMDTNMVIRSVYDALTKAEVKRYDVAAPGDVANPLTFYAALIHILTGHGPGGESGRGTRNKVKAGKPKTAVTVREFVDVDYAHIESTLANTPDALPEIIVYEIDDPKTRQTRKLAAAPRQEEINVNREGVQAKYVLDSAILRDTTKIHFSAYITCGGKDYSFDGASLSRLQPFDWRGKLNKDVTWSFDGRFSYFKFGFRTCYQMLFYYRVK